MGDGDWIRLRSKSDTLWILWAAETLASTVTKEDLARKQLYPALPQIRDISAKVAAAVAEVAYEKGKASPISNSCFVKSENIRNP